MLDHLQTDTPAEIPDLVPIRKRLPYPNAPNNIAYHTTRTEYTKHMKMHDNRKTYTGSTEVPSIDTTVAGISGAQFVGDEETYTIHDAGVRDRRAYVTLSPPFGVLAETILEKIAEGYGTFSMDDVADAMRKRLPG